MDLILFETVILGCSERFELSELYFVLVVLAYFVRTRRRINVMTVMGDSKKDN